MASTPRHGTPATSPRAIATIGSVSLATTAAALPSAGLQELLRRLQDEREALRSSVEELTRQLHSERSARSTVEHELQVKELELLHEQQRSRQAKQSLREKIMALEKELDDERAQHQMALMGRSVAVEKNTALTAELEEMEAKFKKEQAKREDLAVELEQLREDARAIAVERDQIIQRTESDARRVRELWDQITREHEVKAASLRSELEAIERAKAEVDAIVLEQEQRVEELEAALQDATAAKASLEERLRSHDHDTEAVRQRLEQERDKERQSGVEQHALRLRLQEVSARCELLEEREAIAAREKDMAVASLAQCQQELESRTEELLVLKTEFSDLLDRHERQAEDWKQQARAREARVRRRLQTLEQGRHCAEELAKLRKQELQQYKKVLHAVNRRLSDVRGAPPSTEWVANNNTQSMDIRRPQ
ncbi:hypothetical protein P43SY_002094 [Pythium insidiosum]|uniref:Uncharacterized protein n=1 Tax=Pythium insidiosum TaxID=114742 RepID=A0AAD5M874_PYTIN|nr:hypothetical protein P43SY_002094 [Pythium insidiosum]